MRILSDNCSAASDAQREEGGFYSSGDLTFLSLTFMLHIVAEKF